MSKFFYSKLAVTNLKNNKTTYIPYILTCICAVIMFYNAYALTTHNEHGNLHQVLMMGSIAVGLFSSIFLFYTNNFLIKRRKKEFGLFNILGMEKKHIAKIMALENLFVSVFSIVIGLLLGIIFSKLITLLLYKILNFDPRFPFEISMKSIELTVMLFSAIFFLTFLNNILQVYMSHPIELLKGGNVGESEPKTKWLMTTIGLLTLAAGYAIALSVKKPISVIPLFLLAVILVIIGTYCLFTAGSIALLKFLKKNKGYYYQTKHFTSVSGMMYRMKQNAVGLANICIMSTAVLVMISTTVSMYIGIEDALANRYPRDFSLNAMYTPEKEFDEKIVAEKINTLLAKSNRSLSNSNVCNYLSFASLREGNQYTTRQSNYIDEDDNMSMLAVLSAEDYEGLTGNSLSLNSGEAVVYSKRNMDTISILKHTYTVTQQLSDEPLLDSYIAWMVDVVCVILPSKDDVNEIYYAQNQLYGEAASKLKYEFSFDLDMPEDEKAAFTTDVLINGIENEFPDIPFSYQSKQLNKKDFFVVYGGLFFLGIFLGTLFLMATVLIIYYKQVVEGLEDKQRFNIMQKVGMSREEVKKSISSQVFTVFALPIIVAIIHIIVAFPVLTKLLALLNLTNVPLFGVCTVLTVLVFIAIYVIVYKLTSKVYYKIVSQ